MSSWLIRSMKQTIVHWGDPTFDEYNKPTWDSNWPEEILARWENRTDKFIGPQGKEELSQAVVYTTETIALNGFLFLGALNDLDSAQDPTTQAGAYQVRRVENVTDFKNTKTTLYKVFLGTKGG
ncbi:hypothetical protein LCGC14_0717670 [marine sediment metagenome]|uniref:Uncharacterized protein n=1 Tax=marine sediment metagenome TaxID=412755 RepID=A0A0F9QYF5_9ZZZZ